MLPDQKLLDESQQPGLPGVSDPGNVTAPTVWKQFPTAASNHLKIAALTNLPT